MNEVQGHSDPQISVIIPAFNAETTLSMQLDALESQEGAPSFEVIVVDNASTDSTADLIRSRAQTSESTVRLVSGIDRQGPGYARNVGASAARANLLMFADADDVVSRWWVSAGMRAFESSALWSGGARLMTDEEMEGTLDDIRAEVDDSAEWVPVIAGDLTNAFPVLMGGDFGCTREVFERIGGFDQSMRTAFDDNDFGVRAHLAGIPVALAPAVRIAYRGTWGLRFRARLARRQVRGHVLTAERYGLQRKSSMPHPLREMTRSVVAAVLMTVGLRERNWTGPYLRFATGLGLAEGCVRYRLAKRLPATEIGVGYRLTRERRAEVSDNVRTEF